MSAPNGQFERVIKNRNGRYYAGGGVWTADAGEAKVFDDLSLAFEAAHEAGLENCFIIVFRKGPREVDAQFPIP